MKTEVLETGTKKEKSTQFLSLFLSCSCELQYMFIQEIQKINKIKLAEQIWKQYVPGHLNLTSSVEDQEDKNKTVPRKVCFLLTDINIKNNIQTDARTGGQTDLRTANLL